MEAFPENRNKEKPLKGLMIAILAISLSVSSACKVMLPNGKIMTRSAYLQKRKQAREKCDYLLPEPLKKKEFEKIYCHPCAAKFRECINSEFKSPPSQTF
jgi:hypothetical protein